MAVATHQLSHVYPRGSYLDDRGRLHVGGCDVLDLATEFGTPAYIVAEDDLRERAREFKAAFDQLHPGPSQLVFATKAFPCTAVLRLFAEEGLDVDIQVGTGSGENMAALASGAADFAPVDSTGYMLYKGSGKVSGIEYAFAASSF